MFHEDIAFAMSWFIVIVVVVMFPLGLKVHTDRSVLPL